MIWGPRGSWQEDDNDMTGQKWASPGDLNDPTCDI